jgi:hypothetical protein
MKESFEETITVTAQTENVLGSLTSAKLLRAEFDYGDVYAGDYEPTERDMEEMLERVGIKVRDDGVVAVLGSAITRAIHSIEESCIIDAANKQRFENAKRMLEIEPMTVEYEGEDSEGERGFVSAKVAMEVVSMDWETTVLKITNPLHLINGVTDGMGYFAATLPVDSSLAASEGGADLMEGRVGRLLSDLDKVYGVVYTKDNYDRLDSGSATDEHVRQELQYRIGEEMTVEEAAENLLAAIDNDVPGEWPSGERIQSIAGEAAEIITTLGGNVTKTALINTFRRFAGDKAEKYLQLTRE